MLDIIAYLIVALILAPIVIPTLIVIFTITLGPIYAAIVASAQDRK